MLHSIKKLKEGFTPTPNRLWYNDWVEKNADGYVLDVGKSRFWDYGFPTIDIKKELEPTYVGDICKSNISNNIYDMILCNGMYECVDNPQKMVDECIRILKLDGIAIFGFVGKNYYPYKKNWKFYEEGSINFPAEIIKKKDFNNYHFIICKKIHKPSKKTLLD